MQIKELMILQTGLGKDLLVEENLDGDHQIVILCHLLPPHHAVDSKVWEEECHDPSPGTLHIVQQPPVLQNPNALPNFRPCPAPISASLNAPSANSDASPANSNGPLANFDAFPTATDTYPESPEP
ncbi:hypothetical protein J132_06990 [Termitomyces sp. J132]|nr:hypothetical protein J132_06990 [Termitomyces sp. J132]